MDIGRVLGTALRGLQQRRVLGFGMVAALCGLVYATLYGALQLADSAAPGDLATTLAPALPPAFPLWLAGAALVLLVGGLLSEGGLIGAAGPIPPGPAGARRRPAAWRHTTGLIGVGLGVWWPLLLGLALSGAPAVYLLTRGQAASADGAVYTLASAGCSFLLFAAGWLVLWPLQRLANCALLLDGAAPRAAVRAGRRLAFGQAGAVYGLWCGLVLLNAGLWLLSLLLASLAAALVAGLWLLLDGAPEGTALALVGGLAVVLALGLLCWDGAVTAFNLHTWVVAYRALRAPALAPAAAPLPLGTAQLLGRQDPG